MTGLPSSPDQSLPAKLIAEARSAMLDGMEGMDFDPQHVIQIATQTDLRNRLVHLLKSESNDPDLIMLVHNYIRDLIDALEFVSLNSETMIELIDRAGFPVATGTVGLGIALLVGAGIALGPVTVAVSGLCGLAICGAGRTAVKLRINKNKLAVAKLRRLLEDLR